jgi:redox-sensitive bicupin YhaK (pirin superfamily)
MVFLRKSNDRGHLNHEWLDTHHSFSFGDYFDPKFMGFRWLRVINEDYVDGGSGFPTHGHRDMEIISYVVDGALEHKDSMGNGSVIRPGEVQYMSAGSGVRHSEFNPNADEKVHLLQIWIMPKEQGAEPRYAQLDFPREKKLNQLRLIASGQEKEGVIHIRQDGHLYASILEPGKTLEYKATPKWGQWVQLIKGELVVNDQALKAGDALAIEDVSLLKFEAKEEAEFLLFDLA